MPNLDLDDLARLAREAIEPTDSYLAAHDSFYAAAHPAAVLALIERVRRAETLLANETELASGLSGQCSTLAFRVTCAEKERDDATAALAEARRDAEHAESELDDAVDACAVFMADHVPPEVETVAKMIGAIADARDKRIAELEQQRDDAVTIGQRLARDVSEARDALSEDRAALSQARAALTTARTDRDAAVARAERAEADYKAADAQLDRVFALLEESDHGRKAGAEECRRVAREMQALRDAVAAEREASFARVTSIIGQPDEACPHGVGKSAGTCLVCVAERDRASARAEAEALREALLRAREFVDRMAPNTRAMIDRALAARGPR